MVWAAGRGSALKPNWPVFGKAARGLTVSTHSGRAPARGTMMEVEEKGEKTR
jgi:hypothetical protein